MTEWTKIEDPTTLNAGDKIRVVSGSATMEVTLKTGVTAPDWDDEYLVEVQGLPNGDLYLPADTTTFYKEAAPFAVLTKRPEVGQVFEDQAGTQYTLNPLNPDRVISRHVGANIADVAQRALKVRLV